MKRVTFGWSCALAALLAACSWDEAGRGGSSCNFVSISRSGGLCDLTLSCGGATVGLSCSDADCVCTAGGMGGARFTVSGACGMSNDGLASLYQSRCPAAGGDGGAGDGGTNDAVVAMDQPTPKDAPVDAEPEAAADAPRMCTAVGSACGASSECCGTVPACAATLLSSSPVCCKAQGTTCGGASGACCLPYVCRVISGSVRACS